MKNTFILALGLLLAGCGSDTATSTNATSATAAATASAANPDPRAAVIRQQHEQLLAKQKEYVAQLPTLTGAEKLSPTHIEHSTKRFAEIIQQSQANLTALDQLDPANSKDPAQVALIGELAEKQAAVFARGERRLSTIRDEHYAPK